MKKYAKALLAGAVATVMAFSLVACGGTTAPTEGDTQERNFRNKYGSNGNYYDYRYRWGNDQSFNQSAYEGLKALEEELGADKVKISYQESKQDLDYIPNFEKCVGWR